MRHFTEQVLRSIIKLLTVVLDKEIKGRNLSTIFSGNAFCEIPKPVHRLINNYYNEMPQQSLQRVDSLKKKTTATNF